MHMMLLVDRLSDFLVAALKIANLLMITQGSCGKVVVVSC